MDKCLNKLTGANTMNYVTHNERESLANEINGTSLVGTIDASYKEICSLFGKPMRYESGKVDATWVVQFSDDTVATIYNWKDGKAYLKEEGLAVEKIKQWHIGGFASSAQTLVQIALDLKREEKEQTDDSPFEGAFSMMENIVKTRGKEYAALVEVAMLTMKRKQLMDMVIDLLEKQAGGMPKRVKRILEEMDVELCCRTISSACQNVRANV